MPPQPAWKFYQDAAESAIQAADGMKTNRIYVNEMVEHVTHTLVAKIIADQKGESAERFAINLAGLAIQAMEEPTGEMIEAGEASSAKGDSIPQVWRAMIHAALKHKDVAT